MTSQKSLVTSPKPYFSSLAVAVSPDQTTPQRAKKRSSGDLAKRRQRLVTFQLSHTPPSTPIKSVPDQSPLPEPEQSTLESGSWGCHPGKWKLDLKDRMLDLGESYQDLSSPGTPPVQRRPSADYSNQTNPYLLYQSSPLSWWPSPSSCLPPSWLPSNMAPPSPTYCGGCQKWGNLLSVTVSQTRAS